MYSLDKKNTTFNTGNKMECLKKKKKETQQTMEWTYYV